MAIDFESLKDSVLAAAQSGITKAKELKDTGVSKAKEISEVGKLKLQNSTEQDAIRKAYAELGKLYYAERGSAPEAAYVELCQQITDSLAKISYNNERIADIKAAGNIEDEVEDAAIVEEESCCCESAPEESSCCCGCAPEEPAAEEEAKPEE